MFARDPFEPERPFTYECARCGARTERDTHPSTCRQCGGTMLDISVPRE